MQTTGSSGTPAIITEGLTRDFGTNRAVDHMDLRVSEGEIFGLLGPNGAGKSTTIKILTALLRPTSGTARVAGFDVIHEARKVRSSIGYVPQLLSADGSLTGRENLSFSAKLYGLSRSVRRNRIEESLAFMSLEGVADRLVRTYSGGMIRRLELAQAMLHVPRILFLDEPTIGLDPVARHMVQDRLKELRRSFGMTVLITTHDMEEADSLCDVLAIMHRGRVAVTGSPRELKASVGKRASLGDVFTKYSGDSLEKSPESVGDFRSVRQTRRVAGRLG